MIDWVSFRLTGKSACCYFCDSMCARRTPRIWARTTCLPVRHEAQMMLDGDWRLAASPCYDGLISVQYHCWYALVFSPPKKQLAASLENHSSMSSCDSAWILPLGIRTIYTACSIPSLLEIRDSEKTDILEDFSFGGKKIIIEMHLLPFQTAHISDCRRDLNYGRYKIIHNSHISMHSLLYFIKPFFFTSILNPSSKVSQCF